MSATEESNRETNQTGDAGQESSEETRPSKVRDLQPEKDPMGARNLGEEDSATAR